MPIITRDNESELEEQVDFAMRLGSRGVRFGHLMQTPESGGLELPIAEKRAVEARVRSLQQAVSIPVVMAPGYYTADLFPCAPLQRQEFNVDWQGNVTLCCHLSGYASGRDDVAGNLRDISFSEAIARLDAARAHYRYEKQGRHAAGELHDEDYFPCRYCCRYFNKLDGQNWGKAGFVSQLSAS